MTNFEKWVQYFKNSWHCGTHSNIPWHCVLWYATVDWWFQWPQSYREWVHKRVGYCGYVPCPGCVLLRRTPNKVAKCPPKCKRREWLAAYRKARRSRDHPKP